MAKQHSTDASSRPLLPSGAGGRPQSPFEAFYAAILRPIPGLEIESASYDDRLIWVRINAATHADYLARSIFPAMTACPVCGKGPAAGAQGRMTVSVVRQMYADACEQVERERAKGNTRTKWSWLRNRLDDALSQESHKRQQDEYERVLRQVRADERSRRDRDEDEGGGVA
jgi:hypothetical protein